MTEKRMQGERPQSQENRKNNPPPSVAGQHVLFLDGMRGAAALYVTLFHLSTVLPREELAPWAQIAAKLFTEGHLAVGVFIVLSGYLLMLPAARSDAFELRGGVQTFFARRSRRILPPYYAALFLSLPTEIYRQHIHHEAFSIGALVSHLFMVHNLRPDWAGAINAPLWSVAVEFQIYAVFALLLLPLCRRMGNVGAGAACAWVLGMLPLVVLPASHNFSWACPWYLGLFAMGMVGAVITQRGDTLAWTRQANRLPWLLMAVGCFGASILPVWQSYLGFIVRDELIGLATVSCIVCGVRALQQNAARGSGRVIANLFGSRLMVGLGAFSYSLYLTHFPLLSVFDTIFKRFNGHPMALLAFQFVFVLPATLTLAYLFYLMFEKPFVKARSAAASSLPPHPASEPLPAK